MISCVEHVLPDGVKAKLWNLRNPDGAGVSVLDRGATLCSVIVPDRYQAMDDVTLGFDRVDDYFSSREFLGSVVGRYANRLSGSSFVLDGERHVLGSNDGRHTLHGGAYGFDCRTWHGTAIATPEGEGVRLQLTSPDGDQGFPGEVQASVSFVWTADNRLITNFEATTTRPTPINLSLHSYWNLSGQPARCAIGDHLLTLNANRFLSIDAEMIPTGELVPVQATPFDFRSEQRIAEGLEADHLQIAMAGGYDHCWVVDGSGVRPAARLYHPQSGRVLTIKTDQPGIQVYTANHFGARIATRDGSTPYRHCAVALETQQFPDSPNQPSFPNTILRPGRRLHSRTEYNFTTR